MPLAAARQHMRSQHANLPHMSHPSGPTLAGEPSLSMSQGGIKQVGRLGFAVIQPGGSVPTRPPRQMSDSPMPVVPSPAQRVQQEQYAAMQHVQGMQLPNLGLS